MKPESDQPKSTDTSEIAHSTIPPKPDYEEEERRLTVEDMKLAKHICQFEEEGGEEIWYSTPGELRRELQLRGTLRAVRVFRELMAENEAATEEAEKTGILPDQFIELLLGRRGCFVLLKERQQDGTFQTYSLTRWGQWSLVGTDAEDHNGNDDGADHQARWAAFEIGIAYLGTLHCFRQNNKDGGSM
jgi:hypothetical protein